MLGRKHARMSEVKRYTAFCTEGDKHRRWVLRLQLRLLHGHPARPKRKAKVRLEVFSFALSR